MRFFRRKVRGGVDGGGGGGGREFPIVTLEGRWRVVVVIVAQPFSCGEEGIGLYLRSFLLTVVGEEEESRGGRVSDVEVRRGDGGEVRL
jgi:hypothetical protein